MNNEIKIYRGFDQVLDNGIHKNIFRNKPREPIDTNSVMHNVSNTWFYNKFNILARSQAVICSTDIRQAKEYLSNNGSLCEIKPIGYYNIIYSEMVTDFLDYTYEISELTERDIELWLESKNYQRINNLSLLPPSYKGEVMLDCEQFCVNNL